MGLSRLHHAKIQLERDFDRRNSPTSLTSLSAYSIKLVASPSLKQGPTCSAGDFLYNSTSLQAATSKRIDVVIEKRRQNLVVEISPRRLAN